MPAFRFRAIAATALLLLPLSAAAEGLPSLDGVWVDNNGIAYQVRGRSFYYHGSNSFAFSLDCGEVAILGEKVPEAQATSFGAIEGPHCTALITSPEGKEEGELAAVFLVLDDTGEPAFAGMRRNGEDGAWGPIAYLKLPEDEARARGLLR